MNSIAPTVSKTRSFSTVFLIEMWERFGFYGMQALIVYYMVQRLGFDDVRANLVWSAAAALIYVAPAIGGWVGDGILGTRRTMLTGAVILAIGYGLITLPSANPNFLYFSLGVIVVGNGLFKPNAGNLVRKIYEGDDSKIDSAFTIYYMAVNVGSTISMLLTPWIKDYVNNLYQNEFGWHAAFGVCSIGLIVGLVNYFFMRASLAHIGSDPDHHPFNAMKLVKVLVVGAVLAVIAAFILQHEQVAKWFVILAAIALLLIFVYLIVKSQRGERAGLAAALILTLQTIFFFIFYQQMPTSLALFALRNTDFDWSVFGVHLFTWLPGQYQALNPIWIMILSPILAWIYTAAGKRGKDLSIASKFALGFAMVAAGYFVYGMAGNFVTEPGKASSWVLIWGYGLYSLGELLVSGLGLAMIARYVPARMGGFMMGAYYVGVGISQYLGGLVANFAAVPQNVTDPIQTLPIYTALFTKLGWAGVVCTVIAVAMIWPMKRLSATHSSHAARPDIAAEQ
ncbi:MAG: MFS transporter [Xanthomonadales bacterium]|nr:MFS transporter [Xanthomonadales bacterium]ODU92487.1 MAG: amino acid transporter [Rhodanobacter sp. SCN 66-43]OJY86536.1 MAG: MFS transporter [Xanthomonadales bacterium 66-474]